MRTSTSSPRGETLFDMLSPVLASPGQPGGILAAVDEEPEPEPAPDPRGATWRGFTLNHNPDDAALCFLQRYGQPPRFVFPSLGLLLAGPVPGMEGGV